jgi:hypothetical protein
VVAAALVTLLAIVWVVVGAPAAAGWAASLQTIRHTYVLPRDGDLVLTAQTANVSVVARSHARDVVITARVAPGVLLRSRRRRGVLRLTIGGPTGAPALIGPSRASTVTVTVPAGCVAAVTAGVGNLFFRGQFAALTARTGVGRLTATHLDAPQLALSTGVGMVTATGVRGVRGLRLRAGVGTITYRGSVGPSTVVRDGVGSVALRVAPARRLRVTLSTGLGPMRTGFSGLHGGTGWMGRGTPSGQLTATVGMGALSLAPEA